MKFTQTQQGDFFILVQSVLSAAFPIAAVMSYKSISPLVSLTYSSIFTALLFFSLFIFKPKWREFAQPGVLKELFLVALFIGVGYYGFYFFGLSRTTAGNASLIAQMEVFFSYLFFHVWRKDPFDSNHIFGGVLMLLGAAMVLFNKAGGLRLGDLFVLIGTMLPPVGNYYQQKLRKRVSRETVLFGRSLLTLPFLFILAWLLKENLSFAAIRPSLWFLAANGVIFLGISKIFWLEGIHRISVTKANLIVSVTPALTLLLAAVFLRQSPNLLQILSFIPLGIGLWLLTIKKSASEAEMESI